VTDPLTIFAAVAGTLVGVPTLVLVVKVALFFGDLRTTVKGLQKTADRYIRTNDRRTIAIVEDLANHETRLQLAEAGVIQPRIPRKLRALEPLELDDEEPGQ
jgi:hypothetical protein